MCIRKRVFEIIELSKENDKFSQAYDVFMMATILVSLIPLAFKQSHSIFIFIDKITVSIFIVDYLLRLITADYKVHKKRILSFVIYPFSPMAVIDLLSILPSLIAINNGFKLFKIFRLLRTFRVFRVFKVIRYSRSINLFISVFRNQKESLIAVCGIAIIYILVSALIILSVEPESFNNYFDAVYWATVSLTTMGYGDIYPVTTIGRIVTMLSSFFGIAIIAMPAGIITSGLMEELNKDKKSHD